MRDNHTLLPDKWHNLVFEYLRRKGKSGAPRKFILDDVKDQTGKTVPEGSIDRVLRDLSDEKKFGLIRKDVERGFWVCADSALDMPQEDDSLDDVVQDNGDDGSDWEY